MNKIPKRIFWGLVVVAVSLILFSLGIIFWAIIEAKEIKIASWYDYDLAGYPGYSKYYRTCASRDYPRRTILIIIYQSRFTTCVVNDYITHPGRDIDLSSLAFSDLAPLSKGILRGVEIRKRKIQWE